MSSRMVRLRAVEINLLRRALLLYRKAQLQTKVEHSSDERIKKECDDAIAAADRLDHRLLRGDQS
jgi:hypothetical protein